MCKFPKIEYDTNYTKLDNQNIPRGTYTYMINNGVRVKHILDGINNMVKLEETIESMIAAYSENDDESLYRIFCLIQIWGGYWGRIAIQHNIPFEENWNKYLRKKYRHLAQVCINTKANECEYSTVDLKNVLGAICTIIDDNTIHGLGVAFLTKHTRFWLGKNNQKNALPIFDSIIANGLLGSNATTEYLMHYWNCMMYKAKSEGLQLCTLERQLFNYYKANPQMRKKTVNDSTSIPKYWRNDVILEGEWIELDKIPTLVFVGRNNKNHYYCELNLWDNKDANINMLKDAQLIFSRFKEFNWKSRNNQYKYVRFETDDNSKKQAIELMHEITTFF